jgi:hypothetical protein
MNGLFMLRTSYADLGGANGGTRRRAQPLPPASSQAGGALPGLMVPEGPLPGLFLAAPPVVVLPAPPPPPPTPTPPPALIAVAPPPPSSSSVPQAESASWNPISYLPALFGHILNNIVLERPPETVFHQPPYVWNTRVPALPGVARPAALDALYGAPDYLWAIHDGFWCATMTGEARSRWEVQQAWTRTQTLIPLMSMAVDEVRDTFQSIPLPQLSPQDWGESVDNNAMLATTNDGLQQPTTTTRRATMTFLDPVDAASRDEVLGCRQECCLCLEDSGVVWATCKLMPCEHVCMCEACAENYLARVEPVSVDMDTTTVSEGESFWLTPCPLCRAPINCIRTFPQARGRYVTLCNSA